MDPFELLKDDHKKVSNLFEQIESASGQSKSQLFARLKSELDLHAHIEEKYLYPALENKKEARDITLEAYEEHKVVKDLLAELASGSPNDEWDAKLKVLKENVEHHVEEEEGELFDKAEDALSDAQLERMGQQMEAEKIKKQGGQLQSEKKQGAKPSSAQSEDGGPGVLKRLAKLVGLGGSPSKARKATKASKASKSTTRSTTSKPSGKKKAAGTTKKSPGKTKKAGKSSSTTKGRGGSKKRAAKKAPSGRTGAKKSRGR